MICHRRILCALPLIIMVSLVTLELGHRNTHAGKYFFTTCEGQFEGQEFFWRYPFWHESDITNTLGIGFFPDSNQVLLKSSSTKGFFTDMGYLLGGHILNRELFGMMYALRDAAMSWPLRACALIPTPGAPTPAPTPAGQNASNVTVGNWTSVEGQVAFADFAIGKFERDIMYAYGSAPRGRQHDYLINVTDIESIPEAVFESVAEAFKDFTSHFEVDFRQGLVPTSSFYVNEEFGVAPVEAEDYTTLNTASLTDTYELRWRIFDYESRLLDRSPATFVTDEQGVATDVELQEERNLLQLYTKTVEQVPCENVSSTEICFGDVYTPDGFVLDLTQQCTRGATKYERTALERKNPYYMQAVPVDSGTQVSLTPAAGRGSPYFEQPVLLNGPGTWQLFVRWTGTSTVNMTLWVSITEESDNLTEEGNTTDGGSADFYQLWGMSGRGIQPNSMRWQGQGAYEGRVSDTWTLYDFTEEDALLHGSTKSNPMRWTFTEGGVKTFRFVAPVGGLAVDKWLVQLAKYAPPATDPCDPVDVETQKLIFDFNPGCTLSYSNTSCVDAPVGGLICRQTLVRDVYSGATMSNITAHIGDRSTNVGDVPTLQPTNSPTAQPTLTPTLSPSPGAASPTGVPTSAPTTAPSPVHPCGINFFRLAESHHVMDAAGKAINIDPSTRDPISLEIYFRPREINNRRGWLISTERSNNRTYINETTIINCTNTSGHQVPASAPNTTCEEHKLYATLPNETSTRSRGLFLHDYRYGSKLAVPHGKSDNSVYDSTWPYPTNDWTHIVLNFQNLAGVTHYLNHKQWDLNFVAADETFLNGGQPLTLGGAVDGALDHLALADVAVFRAWRTILTKNDAEALYNRAKALHGCDNQGTCGTPTDPTRCNCEHIRYGGDRCQIPFADHTNAPTASPTPAPTALTPAPTAAP